MSEAPWRSDKPSTSQIDYATSLGILIPATATKGTLSDLISLKLHGPAHITYLRAAEDLGLSHPTAISRDRLLEVLSHHLAKDGNERSQAAWYTFRVYRHLVGHVRDAEVESPIDSRIMRIADAIVRSPSLLESVRKASSKSTLLRFGSYLGGEDGAESQASSTSTKAYRFAREELIKAWLIDDPKFRQEVPARYKASYDTTLNPPESDALPDRGRRATATAQQVPKHWNLPKGYGTRPPKFTAADLLGRRPIAFLLALGLLIAVLIITN